MAEKVATIYDYVRLMRSLCAIGCNSCPLSMDNNGTNTPCGTFLRQYPNKASEIILKWCDENPAKTYKDDFLEKLPNAQTHKGFPNVCRDTVYGTNNHKCKTNVKCEDCWNEVYEK